MTTVQLGAQIIGWAFVLTGIVGLIYSHDMEEGLLLGLFPVNVVHSAVHFLLGIWGIAAVRNDRAEPAPPRPARRQRRAAAYGPGGGPCSASA